jgi:hypothetical protein
MIQAALRKDRIYGWQTGIYHFTRDPISSAMLTSDKIQRTLGTNMDDIKPGRFNECRYIPWRSKSDLYLRICGKRRPPKRLGRQHLDA